METKTLILEQRYSPPFEADRLYLYYGTELIGSYGLDEMERAKRDFENFVPSPNKTIAEREV